MKVTMFVWHQSIHVVRYVSVLNCFLDLGSHMSFAMRFNHLEVVEREVIHVFWDMSCANVSQAHVDHNSCFDI
jgi:hypothetical protein